MTTARTLHHLDGKYRVVAQLDHGEVTDVFVGVARGEADFNRLVVLKSLRPTLRYEHEFREMFLTEARLAARLAHPNVVETYEVFEFEGLPVIVMEYLEGETLAQLVASDSSPRLPLAAHLHVLLDALAGLHYSHELTDFDGSALSVVHRDVSPYNLFVTREGKTKILDFGIAKLDSSAVQTASGIIKGKLRYLAPEQLTGRALDRRVDVFAVGILLWEAVTGRKMWGRMSEPQILKALGSRTIPHPRSAAPDLDPRLEAIVLRALALRPEDRYPTALALRLDLEAYLDESNQRVSAADVAREIRDRAGERISERRILVERQARHVARLSPVELESFEPPELTSTSRSEAPKSRVSRYRVPSIVPRVLAIALVLLTLANLGLLLVWWPDAAPQSPDAPLLDEPPEEARLRVTVFPESARLIVNGELVSGNPYVASFPLGSRLNVRAEETGHQSKETILVLHENRDLVLVLEPMGAPAPPGEVERRAPEPR